MPTILAFGNSHLWPFVRGHRSLLDKGEIDYDLAVLDFQQAQYEPFVERKSNGMAVYNPLVVEALRTAIAEHKPIGIATAIHGSDHWRHGVIKGPNPFDIVVPALPQHRMSPGVPLVPYDLFVRRIHIAMLWQFGIVTVLRRLCDLPIFHLEAPPPVENESLALRGVYGHFKEAMDEFGTPTVSHRFKLWWVWSQVAMHICAESGVHFIEGPPETRDNNGFLNEQYYEDGVHGSNAYGALIARELAHAMRGLGLLGG